MGHHIDRSESSLRRYSRDSYVPLAVKQYRIFESITDGSFKPDAARAERVVQLLGLTDQDMVAGSDSGSDENEISDPSTHLMPAVGPVFSGIAVDACFAHHQSGVLHVITAVELCLWQDVQCQLHSRGTCEHSPGGACAMPAMCDTPWPRLGLGISAVSRHLPVETWTGRARRTLCNACSSLPNRAAHRSTLHWRCHFAGSLGTIAPDIGGSMKKGKFRRCSMS